MPAVYRDITGTFTSPDPTGDVKGRVAFELNSPMAIPGLAITPAQVVTVDLEPDGTIPPGFQLQTINVPSTPPGVAYRAVPYIVGEEHPTPLYFQLLDAPGAFDLSNATIEPFPMVAAYATTTALDDAQAAAESYADTVVGTEQARALAAETAVTEDLAGWMAARGFAVRFHTAFHESDKQAALDLNDGVHTPTGQRWSATGAATTSAKWTISNHEGRFNPLDSAAGTASPQQAVVVLDEVPDIIASDGYFLDGSTAGEDRILGATATTFSDRSIQSKESRTGWSLFYTIVNTDPASPNYGQPGTSQVVLASGTFAAPIPAGQRRRGALQVDLANSEATLHLSDGTVHTVTAPQIAAYWGRKVIVQLRRGLATDGEHRWKAVTAGTSVARRTPIDSQLYLPRDVGIDLQTSRPSWWTPGAFTVEIGCTPDVVGQQEALVSLWGSSGTAAVCSWSLIKQSSGKLALEVAPDGISSNKVTGNSNGSAVGTPTDRTCYRVIYDGAGNATFDEGTDDNAANPTGTYAASHGTAVLAATAPFPAPFTSPLEVGGRGNSSAFPFGGRLRWVRITDTSTGRVVAFLDLRRIPTGDPVVIRDPQFNIWRLRSESSAGAFPKWMLATSAVVGLDTTLASLGSAPAPLGNLATEASLTNDATNTTVFTGTTVAATALAAGKTVLRFRTEYNIDSTNTSGANNMRLYINGTLVDTITAAAACTSTYTGKAGWVDLDVYVDAVGSGGTVSLVGLVNRLSGTGTLTTEVHETIGAAVDLSAGLTFSMKMQMATAAPANVWRVRRANLWKFQAA